MLRVEGVSKTFPITRGVVLQRTIGGVSAVDDVSFTIAPGETLGLVGESGCGKSTLARLLLRLEEASAGHAFWKDEDIFAMNKRQLHRLRRTVQVVFQDPYASLNPRMTVGDTVA